MDPRHRLPVRRCFFAAANDCCLQRSEDKLNANVDAAAGGIDSQVIPIPWMIVAPDHGAPIGKD
jgi:hypothetical protein